MSLPKRRTSRARGRQRRAVNMRLAVPTLVECGNCGNRVMPHRDDLFEKMKKLIADRLEIDEAKITLDSSFRQDLGADSLDTYELVYAIEEELGISIPDEKANEFETVRDALEYIKSQLEQKK
jgi:acyl carrier protein